MPLLISLSRWSRSAGRSGSESQSFGGVSWGRVQWPAAPAGPPAGGAGVPERSGGTPGALRLTVLSAAQRQVQPGWVCAHADAGLGWDLHPQTLRYDTPQISSGLVPGRNYHPLALNYDTFVQALKLNHNHFIPRAFERRMSALAAPQGMPCHFQRFIIVWFTPAVPTGPIFLSFSPPSASKWRIAREHFFFFVH